MFVRTAMRSIRQTSTIWGFLILQINHVQTLNITHSETDWETYVTNPSSFRACTSASAVSALDLCLTQCCFPVLSCRAAAEGHCYPAIQPTWILPADAAWRHHGQHKRWKQLILWVCVCVCFCLLPTRLLAVASCNSNQIIHSLVSSSPIGEQGRKTILYLNAWNIIM